MKNLTAILLLVFAQPVFSQNSGTYSLRQCIDIALSKNLVLKQGEYVIASNQVQVNQAQMNRYPNLNAGATQSVNYGRSVNPYDNTVVADQQVNSNNLSLSSSVNLFSGFQNTYTIQQRQLNLKASREDVKTTQNNVMLSVVDAFANVLSTKALLSSARVQFESTKGQIDRTSKLVQAGRLSNNNLLDLKSQMATEETNIVMAENNLELAKLALAQWMQTDPAMIQDVVEPNLVINEVAEVPASQIYAIAESNQPQIQAANTRVMSAEKGIAIAKSGYSPTLSLQAGLFTNYSSLAQRFVQGKPTTTPVYGPPTQLSISDSLPPITIRQVSYREPGTFQELTFQDQFNNNLRKGFTFNLNIPLFNGMQTKLATETARINRLNAQNQLEQQKNQLRQTIETATANEKAARNRLAAIQKQITAMEESYRMAEERFNLGILNSVEFIISKNNLIRAENERLRFKYDFFIRRSVLDFYLGKDLNFN